MSARRPSNCTPVVMPMPRRRPKWLQELKRVADGVAFGLPQGLIVNAGHGLHYHNVEAVAAIKGINELNIGHALVAHALFVGFKSAVSEMKALILAAAAKAETDAIPIVGASLLATGGFHAGRQRAGSATLRFRQTRCYKW